jgi:hypothetical protein
VSARPAAPFPIVAPAAGRVTDPRSAAPSFSIVIPAYESATTIGEAVESALAQNPPPREVIVADDGSTDELDEALTPFAAEITTVRREHAGVAAARNSGWRAAQGEFVLFADADDILLPGKLAALGELARERPDVDLLCTDMYFERDGERSGRFGQVNSFPIDAQRTIILERCFVIQPAFRRSRLQEIGGFDESLATAEDWDCVLRLVLAGSVAGLWDEPLAVYRIHPGSLTHARTETMRDRLRMLEKARENRDLRASEHSAAERAVVGQRARTRLAEAQAAVAEGRPDARRRCLRLTVTRSVEMRIRLWAFSIAILPRTLQRRVGRLLSGPSQLSRLLPSDDSDRP